MSNITNMSEALATLFEGVNMSVFYETLPPKGDCIVIDENYTSNQSIELEEKDGFDIESEFHIYVRCSALRYKAEEVCNILQDFYKKIKAKSKQTEKFYDYNLVYTREKSNIIRVEVDTQNNYHFSYNIGIRYIKGAK